MASTAPKRSLFNKPTWAAKAASPIEADSPVFGQNHVYSDIIEEERSRRERHAQKVRQHKEQEEHRIEDAKDRKQPEAVPVGKTKRRRISKKDHDRDDNDTESDTAVAEDENLDAPSSQRSREASVTLLDEKPVRRSTPMTDEGSTTARKPGSTKPTQKKGKDSPGKLRSSSKVDDDSDNAVEHLSTSKCPELDNEISLVQTKVTTIHADSDSGDEDETIRELKRRARAAARHEQTHPEPRAISTASHASASLSPRNDIGVVTVDSQRLSTEQPASHQDTGGDVTSTTVVDADDPVIEILVKTIIPGARSLVVSRRMSQPLDKVKEFWCQRNELPPITVAKVFLTWNGNRLYNSTTMRGILALLKQTYPDKDANGKVEIEAVTEEIFVYRQKQAEQHKTEEAGTKPEDDKENRVEEAKTESEERIVICLTCQDNDTDDLQLRVRHNTTMLKIAYGFCKAKGISLSGRQCWLVFDGERLEPGRTVQDVGFEHEDTIEVHLT